jgi:hypothetical protein
MTTPREAEEMTTPAEMSWDHHIVADDDQAVPAAPVADPASATAEETAWGPRIAAPAHDDQPLPEPPSVDPASATAEETAWGPRIVVATEDDQPLPEPPISDPASAAEQASPEPAAPAPSQLPGGPELGSAAAEPGIATGADAEKTPTATAPAPEPASASAADADSINLDVRWHQILAMFVDDPRSSVEQAAALADDRAEALVLSIKERQDSLLSGWQRHDAETEELRLALQQYRIFCNRLEELSH